MAGAGVAAATLVSGAPSGVLPPGVAGAGVAGAAGGPRVLLVGTWRGRPGQYGSIQAAVDAARPGDWVLVGPGDYRSPGPGIAGVVVTTGGIHIRGMDRNGVIVDGTSAGAPCSSTSQAQHFGQGGAGRNGVEVLKASGVTVENLTICNFLAGPGGHNGNQLWFNGGDGSGRIGLGSYRSAYVTASRCEGGVNLAGAACSFAATGNEVANNAFSNNGFFSDPGNADLGLIDFPLGPGDCFHGHTDTSGFVSSDPPLIQLVDGVCGQVSVPGALAAIQTICASGLIASLVPALGCPRTPVINYPPVTTVTLDPVPAAVGLANPCADVPSNEWC